MVSHPPSASAACARALVAQLIAQGVREFVVCPGSRSAPLALAAFDADARGQARLHVRIDERSAAFLALGLGKGSGAPAAVITTSGTAVGNLMPAVMEAHHSGVPLVLVTADRPASLVGFGANQTTEQVGIFGGFVRYAARVTSSADEATWTAQAAKAAVLAQQGPVHLNVELAPPLVDGTDAPAPPQVRRLELAPAAPPVPMALPAEPRTVVVAGDASWEQGRAAVDLARAAGLPLIAEPSSNARVHPALTTGRLLLDTPLASQIERVIVFGHPTLTRPVMALLARADVEVVVVAQASWPDPGHRARLVAGAVEIPPSDAAWLVRWVDADARLLHGLSALRHDPAAPRDGADERLDGLALARAAWAAAAGHGAGLVLGASQIMRDADLAPVGPDAAPVFANRGLAGIDGTVSTAAGVAWGRGRPALLVCGDLTFLHDSNGLAIGPAEPRPDLRIVVGDDRGGAIFSSLEYGAADYAEPFERVFGTDPGVDVGALAESYGVPVTRVHDRASLDAALARPIVGLDVVVVPLQRDARRAQEDAFRAVAAHL